MQDEIPRAEQGRADAGKGNESTQTHAAAAAAGGTEEAKQLAMAAAPPSNVCLQIEPGV